MALAWIYNQQVFKKEYWKSGYKTLRFTEEENISNHYYNLMVGR